MMSPSIASGWQLLVMMVIQLFTRLVSCALVNPIEASIIFWMSQCCLNISDIYVLADLHITYAISTVVVAWLTSLAILGNSPPPPPPHAQTQTHLHLVMSVPAVLLHMYNICKPVKNGARIRDWSIVELDCDHIVPLLERLLLKCHLTVVLSLSLSPSLSLSL